MDDRTLRFRTTADSAAPQHGPRPLPLFLDMLRSETAESPERTAAALAGLRRYQEAPRAPHRPRPARFRKGPARLRDHGGVRGEGGAHVVFVPSLINPPFVLDLAPGRSLIGHVADAGHRCWLVDWGVPRPQDRDLDVAGHVTDRLLPLLAKLDAPFVLVGYCLGGTIATAAATLSGARCAGLATIAAPWRMAGYGEAARADIAALWRDAEPLCHALGLLPMEVLQSGFWRLDPGRTVAKFEAFAGLDDDAARTFVALEDWANDGAPLTYAAGRDLFERFVGADDPGERRWQVGGTTIDPHALACPATEFVSLTDRIVPAATAAGLPARHDVAAGHVGMVVGGKAERMLWTPLVEWLRSIPAAVEPAA